jgi:heat shock protein HtpX
MQTQSRPRWYKADLGLATRMTLTMFLLGALYVAFIFVLHIAFSNIGLIPLILVAGVLAGIQFFFADKIALMSMGAQIVDEAQAPELHEIVGRLAAQANLPKPRIAIVNTSIPNAFATGRDQHHAVIAITTGLLNMYNLDKAEIEGVLAHELTHIINRDMLVMTVATFFSMVASIIIQNVFWFGGGFGGGYGRRRDEGSGIMLAFLAAIVTYAVSFFLIRGLSRYRELAADRGGALITGAPGQLASALMKISNGVQNGRIPQQDFRQASAVSALFIVPAVRGDDVATLFSTHPSTEERVRRLQDMQRQMEGAHYLG